MLSGRSLGRPRSRVYRGRSAFWCAYRLSLEMTIIGERMNTPLHWSLRYAGACELWRLAPEQFFGPCNYSDTAKSWKNVKPNISLVLQFLRGEDFATRSKTEFRKIENFEFFRIDGWVLTSRTIFVNCLTNFSFRIHLAHRAQQCPKFTRVELYLEVRGRNETFDEWC